MGIYLVIHYDLDNPRAISCTHYKPMNINNYMVNDGKTKTVNVLVIKYIK